MIGDHYIGLFCPTCGRGLKQDYEGTIRILGCIRGHWWKTSIEGDRGEILVLRSVQEVAQGGQERSGLEP